MRVRYSCIAAMSKYCLMQMMMFHVRFSVIWENWHLQIFRLPWINIIVTCADVMNVIIDLRSRGIRRFKLKYVDLQKRKHQIFASQIIVFSLKYWEVRTRMAFKKKFFNARVQLSGLLITWLKCSGGSLVKFQTDIVSIFKETKIFNNLWNFHKHPLRKTYSGNWNRNEIAKP